MESSSPLAFSGQLPAGKQQRGPGSGQFSVDLGWGRGEGAVLKMPLGTEFGSDWDLVTLEDKNLGCPVLADYMVVKQEWTL